LNQLLAYFSSQCITTYYVAALRDVCRAVQLSDIPPPQSGLHSVVV